MKFTEKEARKVSLLLSEQIEILEKENRIGRCQYFNLEDRDRQLLENAIRMIAEEAWNKVK